MLPGTLPFNLALAVVAMVAWRLGRGRAGAVLTFTGVAALLLAPLLGGGHFGTMRLHAWALFAHAPVLALVFAWRLRARSRASTTALALLAVTLLGVAAFAFLLEPRRLEVSHHEVAAPSLSSPLRLVLVADIQTDRVGGHERRALAAVAAARPDLVVLAGDYVQVVDPQQRRAELRALGEAWRAAGIAPRLGTVAVQGNTDHDGWEDAFAGLPVSTTSATRRFRRGELAITALSFQDSFDTGLRVRRARGYHVVLGHAPDYALGEVRADLLLAGHVHGGQVRLPFVGPLLTLSAVPRGWAVGRTELPGGRTLIVSRGIGMERADAPRLRFLCRPEVVVIDLVPAAATAAARPPAAARGS